MKKLKHLLDGLAERLPEYQVNEFNGKLGGKPVHDSYGEYTKGVEADFVRLFLHSSKPTLGLSFYYENELEPTIRVSTQNSKSSDAQYSVSIPTDVFKNMMKETMKSNANNSDLINIITATFIYGKIESDSAQIIVERNEKTSEFRESFSSTLDKICQPILDTSKKYNAEGKNADTIRNEKARIVKEALDKTDESKEVARLELLLAEANRKKKEKRNKIAKQLKFDVFNESLRSDKNTIEQRITVKVIEMLELYATLEGDEKHAAKVLIVERISYLSRAYSAIMGHPLGNDNWSIQSQLRKYQIFGVKLNFDK